MCKDTFGKQAINWRSMTPCLKRWGPKMMFHTSTLLMAKTTDFSPFLWIGHSHHRKGCVHTWFGRARRSCHRVHCAWWLLSITAVYALWTRQEENDRVHKLINKCAAKSCQNLTLIVKLQAFLWGKKKKIKYWWINLVQKINYHSLIRSKKF